MSYLVGIPQNKRKELYTETDIKVKANKTDCKRFNVNAQPVLTKVLLYL